jgi:hypothetical protein
MGRGGQGVSGGTRERQVADAVRPVRRAELSDAAAAALTLTRTRGQFARVNLRISPDFLLGF